MSKPQNVDEVLETLINLAVHGRYGILQDIQPTKLALRQLIDEKLSKVYIHLGHIDDEARDLVSLADVKRALDMVFGDQEK